MPAMALWLTCSHVGLFWTSCPVLRSFTFLSFGNKFSSKVTKHTLEWNSFVSFLKGLCYSKWLFPWFGVQEWRSDESTRLPPVWLGFDSLTRRHMWVEFVVSLLCIEGFFSSLTPFLNMLLDLRSLLISVYSVPNQCSSARTNKHLISCFPFRFFPKM